MKKILSLALVLVMIFSALVGVVSFAETETTSAGALKVSAANLEFRIFHLQLLEQCVFVRQGILDHLCEGGVHFDQLFSMLYLNGALGIHAGLTVNISAIAVVLTNVLLAVLNLFHF